MLEPDPLAVHDLVAFLAAADAGTIQGAADALQLTQSAATKRIGRLEARLGESLFVRRARGVELTAAGRTLYPHAAEAIEALRRGEAQVRALRVHEQHVVRLSASHTVGGFLLPKWLAALRVELPRVVPQVDVVNSPAVLRLVRAGDADIGFVEGDDDLSGLQTLRVGQDELVVVVGASHPWAERECISPLDLTSEPFLARERGSGTRSVAESRLARAGVTLVGVAEIANTGGLKRAVAESGFAIMSRHAVELELALGSMRALRVLDVDLRRDLVAVRRPIGATVTAQRVWLWLSSRPY